MGGIDRIEKSFQSRNGKLFLNYNPENIFTKVLCSTKIDETRNGSSNQNQKSSLILNNNDDDQPLLSSSTPANQTTNDATTSAALASCSSMLGLLIKV